MKIIILLVLIVCSCEMAPISFAVYSEIPDLGLKTIQEVMATVDENIDYAVERTDKIDWQNPGVTYWLRTGDCEDFAILAMYLAHRIGIESRMVVGTCKITNRGHAWVEAEDNWWEPQIGRMCNHYIIYYKDFVYYDYDYLLGGYEL